MRLKILLVFTALNLFLQPCYLLAAEEVPVPADLQVSLILKILTYDRVLKDRCPESVEIGILYIEGNKESESNRDQVLKVFQNLGNNRTISQLPFNFKTVKWESEDKLMEAITKQKINLLYVMPGQADNLGKIKAISQKQKILTVSGVPSYAKSGLSVALGVENQKPQIIINLPASKAEGVDFDSKLLRISTVYKE